jgi:hypothetical protein
MNETATGVTFAPGPETMDPTGSVMISTAVLNGNVVGTPITGTLNIEEVRTRPVEANSGSVEGQFTLTDGFGSTITGDLSGDFTMGPGSTTASGQFFVRGGTGPFTGASGTGTFTVNVGDRTASPSTVTLSSTAFSFGGVPAASVSAYPGIVPPPSYVPAQVAPPVFAPAYVAPAYVAPPVAPASYTAPGYNGLPGYDPNYAAAQAQAAAQAAAQAQAAAAQATQPQVIVVPVPESEWDPNGVLDRPARSSATNRNYR